MIFSRWLAFGLCFFLGACQLHFVDTRIEPTVPLNTAYSTATLLTQEQPTTLWWQSFERPALDELVAQALAGNLSITQALARVQQAEALVQQAEGARLPQLKAALNTSNNWQDGNTQRGGANLGAELNGDIDLFNELGAAQQAQDYLYQARKEDVNAVRLDLVVAVSDAYFGAIAAMKTLALLERQLQTDKDLLELIQLRRKSGVSTIVEELQQQSRVLDSRSLIPLAQAQVQLHENRLDVLLGKLPDGILRVPSNDDLNFDEPMPVIGVPAELLLNRPDLRIARAELIATDAEVAEAIAQRLPAIRLNGSYRYQDSSSFTGPVGLIASSFVQPLLDWGQRRAAVVQNKAVYQAQLAQFSLGYLNAVEDVENALAAELSQREFLYYLQQRQQLLSETVAQTEARYKQGVDSYLPVLNALQELRNVERDLVRQQLTLVLNRIELHRSLGGSSVALQTATAL